MAPIISMKKGFTLLEMAIVILLFSFIILILSSVYTTVIRASILANDYYQSLENVRLGTEKIWRLLKYGWSFNISNSSVEFKRKDCIPLKIYFDQTKKFLYYCENSNCSSLFDENLVKVKDFRVETDTPNTNQKYAYFQYAPKLIILYYDLDITSKRGNITNLKFQQAVAPINSTYSINLCE